MVNEKTITAAPVPGTETAASESVNQSINLQNNTAMEQTNNRSLAADNGDDAIRRNTTVSLMAIGATAILGFIVFAAVRQNTK